MHEETIKLSTLEYRASAFSALWGVWLLLGNDTSLDAVAFQELVATWVDLIPGASARISLGVTSLIIGLVYLAAVRINGLGMLWTPAFRLIACGFNSALFFSVAWSIAQVDPHSPGVFAYMAISLAFANICLRNVRRFEISILIMLERIRGRNN